MTTLHGEVETPVFMPVGTRATVRGQTVRTLKNAGSRVLLANTWHLLLKPGVEVFRKFGGIHRFMSWDGAVLTDSGGYQIFSLAHARTMKEEGAEFTAPTGHRILLSPELSIETQRAIGSDIMMALDQCVPSTCSREEAKVAMDLTHRWAGRSLAARGDSPQALFGIVQGACFEDLRKESAAAITGLPFDGFAIGGLAVGEGKAEREAMTELVTALLPRERPRYLMGVGTPLDLLEAVHRGVDMFDCILPTQYAQRGYAFTSRGKLALRRGAYELSEDRLDPACDCPTCESHSRAYLHFLIKSGEVLGWQLIGEHNLRFYHRLTRRMRAAILDGSFEALYREQREVFALSDEDAPVTTPKPKRRKPKPPRELGRFEIVGSDSGFSSVRDRASGEIMHSVNDPLEEARSVYVRQSGLAQGAAEKPLVLWDVGLGAATNAMAAILELEAVATRGPVHPVTIVSFENDLDSLRLASGHPAEFPHLRHAAPGRLLRDGFWGSADGKIRWQLVEGDFKDTVAAAAAPDLIFYDPFSYKTDGELWTLKAFARVAERCHGRAVELFTYSASTAVRAALLGAGFRVAKGVGTGPKEETTIALTPEAEVRERYPLLGPEWLLRWERSRAQLPLGLEEAQKDAFLEKIRSSPQFLRQAEGQAR